MAGDHLETAVTQNRKRVSTEKADSISKVCCTSLKLVRRCQQSRLSHNRKSFGSWPSIQFAATGDFAAIRLTAGILSGDNPAACEHIVETTTAPRSALHMFIRNSFKAFDCARDTRGCRLRPRLYFALVVGTLLSPAIGFAQVNLFSVGGSYSLLLLLLLQQPRKL